MFQKEGYVCIIDRSLGEIYEHYYLRGLFVVSQKPNSKEEYDKAVAYSRIYINVIHLKCIYSDEIMEELNKMINNIHSID